MKAKVAVMPTAGYLCRMPFLNENGHSSRRNNCPT
jgi:hypothetical protein